MKLSQELHKEINQSVKGTYAPYLYRYNGMRNHMDEQIALKRAWGINFLFSHSEPHLFASDLIAGSTRGLFVEEDEAVLNHAKELINRIGSRSFFTNFDHFAPNYKKLISVGIGGLIDEIDAQREKYSEDAKRCETLDAMKITLTGFRQMIANYAKKAESLMSDERYSKERLRSIAKNCSAVAQRAPQSFAEALQLVWICHTAFVMEDRYAMALGRMDQYLYPFYKNDTERGIITKEEAVELLENVFAKISSDDVVNICIGGMNKEHKCEINELSYCILQAVKNNMAPGPNLSVRLTEDTPDDFLDEALKSIGTGLGYPALMNDRVNIEALKKYGYDHDDIYDYCMVGCLENFLCAKQPPWTDGRFDTPKYIDYIFNNGISRFNKSVGINTGDLKDIDSMEKFVECFAKQLKYGVDEYCTLFEAQNGSICQQYYSEPFLSCFCDSCIERGLDINDGGSKYPSVHGVGIMGMGTVCDSLAAIEKVVFVDKKASLEDIKTALNSNFEGCDELRQMLQKAPKYGNNDDFADKYAVWLVDLMSSLFAPKKTRDKGGIYIAMAANVQNISSGKITAATPDGRKQGEPLSDAASPTYGKDTNGITSTLCSVSKPDYTKIACGTVINQKLPPSVFEDGPRQKLLALIKTYIKMGGQELQINATSRDVLEEAMLDPEKYGNLVVRVSGFSDYFVKLSKEVQLDILNRTQQKI